MNYTNYWVGTYCFDIKLVLTIIKKQVDELLEQIEKTEKMLG